MKHVVLQSEYHRERAMRNEAGFQLSDPHPQERAGAEPDPPGGGDRRQPEGKPGMPGPISVRFLPFAKRWGFPLKLSSGKRQTEAKRTAGC